MPEGLYDKYTVKKNHGETDPEARYFVLRLDTDPKARIAAFVYAALCLNDDYQLGGDLYALVEALMTPIEKALCRVVTQAW